MNIIEVVMKNRSLYDHNREIPNSVLHPRLYYMIHL